MKTSELVFVGIRGSVVALNKSTGQLIWSKRLKSYDFVNVIVEEDKVLATTYGEIFCLDALNGQLLWQNQLKGFGIGITTIVTARSAGTMTPAMVEQRRRDAASSSAGATTTAAS
jgi:outer membrane protein assembly factor BamB